MANENSIRKVMKVLEDRQQPASIFQICKEVGLSATSVVSIARFLADFDKVEIISNGKITLVRLKEVEVANAN